MALPLLALPIKPVYSRLHTDHYPWSEVTADLAVRQKQGFSGVFEAEVSGQWVRFVWVAGKLQGGYMSQGFVQWPAMMAGMPRAEVSLYETSPAEAQIIWASTSRPFEPESTPWPQLHQQLQKSKLTGAVLGGDSLSYWADGQLVSGELPPVGASVQVLALQRQAPFTPQSLMNFWSDLFAATERVRPLEDAWRQVCVTLAPEHPILDPFAREVSLERGILQLPTDVTSEEIMEEIHPALRAAYPLVLQKAGLSLGELPLTELSGRPEWKFADLEQV